jgi:hypothetical protein
MILHPEIIELLKSDEVLEPETLRQVHPELTEEEFNEIMALKTLYKTRGFWENMYVFEDIVHALNGRIPDPTRIEGASPEEIWYALDIARRIRPDIEYAPEIVLYTKFWFNEAGVFIYPPYIPIPCPYFETVKYRSENGPFPLGESEQEIQAAKLLIIETYIKNKKGAIV